VTTTAAAASAGDIGTRTVLAAKLLSASSDGTARDLTITSCMTAFIVAHMRSFLIPSNSFLTTQPQ
jgi:hypothetical protein